MVTSTSKAQAGPRTVALHLEGSSCVGLVASKGSALQANLSGPAGALLSNFSDIQHMIKETELSSPIGYVVCMPIQPSSSSSKGVTGALLLGFSSTPDFSARRAAGVAALCSMLSETLIHYAPAVICNVETMIGRHTGCACCCPDSGDDMEEVADEPCNDADKSSGGKDKGGPPRQSMLIPIQEGEGEEEEAGGSGKNSPREKRGKENVSYTKNTESTSPAAAVTPVAPIAPPPSTTYLTGMPTNGGYTFSKPVKASITRELLNARDPITLSYTDPALENEFTNWLQDRLKPVDFLFSMLVVASVILLAYCRPETSVDAVANTLVSGTRKILPLWSDIVALPVLLPAFLALFFSPQLHQRFREVIVAVVRIYLVVAASNSALSQLQATQQRITNVGDASAIGLSMTTSPTETAASFLACWIAAGGETLLTPAFGLQLRMKWHLPLQAAAVAVMCYNVKCLCGPSFYLAAGFLPQAGAINCVLTFAAAGLVAFAVPTALLRASEIKSRQQFEAQIAAAAGITTN